MSKNNSISDLDLKTDLYFHMPFCAKKCGYCYFYSLENQGVAAVNKYLDYLEKEIVLKKELWKFPEGIRAVYIGGGTPSYLSLASLEKLFKILHKHFEIDKDVEFTMEINPSVCDKKKIDLIKKNGVNRLSFGIQTVSPALLQKVQRFFNKKQAVEMIRYAKKIKFKTINLDFMFRLPEQNLQLIADDIAFIKKINPTSVYWYETKDVTDYMKAMNKDNTESQKFDSFIWAEMKKLKYKRTMTEFFSKDNKPCQYTFDFLLADYIVSFGPFSISKYKNSFLKNISDINKYYDFLDNKKLPIWQKFELNDEEGAASFLAYLLRFGSADLEYINKKFGVALEISLKREIHLLKKHGFLKQEGSELILTKNGLLYTPDVQIAILHKYEKFLKNLNVFLGREYGLK